MKRNTRVLCSLLALILCLALTACSSVPANTVFGVEDLPGKAIGVQLGTTGDELASDYESQGSTVERYNKGASAIMALKQGKIDCVIIDEQPAKAFVEANEDLKILEDPFEQEEYAIAIAKENTELKEKINAALAELKADGTLASIESNYIGDNKGESPYVSPEGVDRSNGTLTMGTNATFEPYEYYAEDKIVGIDIDMMQAVCDRLGMELVVEDMEFNALVMAVQTGTIDVAAAGMTVTPDRLESVDFSDPYTTAAQVIIVRAE